MSRFDLQKHILNTSKEFFAKKEHMLKTIITNIWGVDEEFIKNNKQEFTILIDKKTNVERYIWQNHNKIISISTDYSYSKISLSANVEYKEFVYSLLKLSDNDIFNSEEHKKGN